MQGPYPEMLESVQRVARVVKDEEHRYATTFLVAEKRVQRGDQEHCGRTAFPARSRSSCTTPTGWRSTSRRRWRASTASTIDREGFESEMEQQRERARASWKGAEKGAMAPAYQTLVEQGRTKFLGYSELEATSRVIGLLVDKQPVEQVPAGAKAELVLDQTPFYAETGGQVGDHGVLYCGRRARRWRTWRRHSPAFPG